MLTQYEKNVKEPSADCVLIKLELEESKKKEDVLRKQLTESETRCEKLEEEIVTVRKELEKFQALYHQNLSSIKASEELSNILNKQRSPLIKSGLGYEQGSSNSSSENKGITRVINFQSSKQSEFTKSAISNKAETSKNNLKAREHEEGIQNKVTRQYTPRRQTRYMYQNFFNGYCYCCSNFGHKAANCKFNFRNRHQRISSNNQLLQHKFNQTVGNRNHHTPTIKRETHDRNVNSFDLLYDEPECYICHNFGHKAAKCYLKNYKSDSRVNCSVEKEKVWRKKEDNKCGLVLSAQRQKDPWYIDSGCSKHMSGDKSKFMSLTEHKSGNVTFGNDAPGKIRGKGMVSLSNGKGKAQDVLFVDGLKHNLLSVSQMCDKGCEVVFNSKECKIKSVSSGQLVAKGIRT